MRLREAVQAILAHVEGEMSSARNKASLVCCGRSGMECCGSPEPEWDEADKLIMDILAPVQRALRDALAEASKAEPAPELIAMARRYQWVRKNPDWETEMALSCMTPEQYDAAIDAAMKCK